MNISLWNGMITVIFGTIKLMLLGMLKIFYKNDFKIFQVF